MDNSRVSPILSPTPENPWQIGAVNRLQWSNATWNETKTTPPYRNGMPFVVEYYSVEDFTTQHLDPIQGISGSIGVEVPANATPGDYRMQWIYYAPGVPNVTDGSEVFFAFQNFTMLPPFDQVVQSQTGSAGDYTDHLKDHSDSDSARTSSKTSSIVMTIVGALSLLAMNAY